MKLKFGFMLFAAIIMSLSFSSCLKRAGEKMMDQLETIEEELSEVGESVTQLGLDGVFDEVIEGLHVVMSYDAENHLFRGTLENTTEETLKEIEVEIHLSNGKELGPEEFAEMTPEMDFVVDFEAGEEDFKTWSVHVEVGSEEPEGEAGDEDNVEEEED